MAVVIVPIDPVSDGDKTHRPAPGTHQLVDPPTGYLEKLGQSWMTDRGEAKPGVIYRLDRLPDGYALFGRPRPNDPKTIDRHLYGHPLRKWFDSPNRFYPHFKYLMENNGSNLGCPCTRCNSSGGVLGPIAAGGGGKSTGKASQQFKSEKTDEEGVPDVYRKLIDRLKKEDQIDEPISEPYSLDWQAERANLPKILDDIGRQPAWVPRIGEIVLFVRKLNPGEEICFRDEQGNDADYGLWSTTAYQFVGKPIWEAAVIGQVAVEQPTIEDLVKESFKVANVTQSGFRVEPLPDVNGRDKNLSKRMCYVPLHHLRPFAFYREFLNKIPEEDWHPTIKHALSIMATFSLVEKYHFKGAWPDADISCRGIYIGAELILVGDTVRLGPAGSRVRDILQITSIRLHLAGLDKSSDNDRDGGHPYQSTVVIAGKAFTLKPKGDSFKAVNAKAPAILPNLQDYGDWEYRHAHDKKLQVAFSRVLGRIYEPEAMLLWFPPLSTSDGDLDVSESVDLSKGLDGIRSAREYATANDKRISHGRKWYWGDHRAESLDLHTINGLEGSEYFYHRTL